MNVAAVCIHVGSLLCTQSLHVYIWAEKGRVYEILVYMRLSVAACSACVNLIWQAGLLFQFGMGLPIHVDRPMQERFIWVNFGHVYFSLPHTFKYMGMPVYIQAAFVNGYQHSHKSSTPSNYYETKSNKLLFHLILMPLQGLLSLQVCLIQKHQKMSSFTLQPLPHSPRTLLVQLL